jgi:L-alanine-DL-glutamate epimerase-like enolase superfamily enzyme
LIAHIKEKSAIKLDFETLTLKTQHPFGISYGSSSETKNVLVKLTWQDIEGLGEAAPAKYHNESQATVMAVLNTWKNENVLGDDPFAVDEIMQKLNKSIAGNTSAKAAIEMALHDIVGKQCNLPLYKLFGLTNLKPPMTDFTIGIDNLDVIEKKTEEALASGYKIFKVKQGTNYDKDIIKRIRSIAPNTPLRVDANGAWTPKQAVSMSHFLYEQNVQFIEQPLPKNAQIEDFRFVKDHSAIPIFADESICTASDVARLHTAIDGIVIKLCKTGGIKEALRLVHTARAHGLSVMFGCMIESSIGITAAAHISHLADYLDLDGALLLANDPYCGAKYSDGYLMPTDLPGLGVRSI